MLRSVTLLKAVSTSTDGTTLLLLLVLGVTALPFPHYDIHTTIANLPTRQCLQMRTNHWNSLQHNHLPCVAVVNTAPEMIPISFCSGSGSGSGSCLLSCTFFVFFALVSSFQRNHLAVGVAPPHTYTHTSYNKCRSVRANTLGCQHWRDCCTCWLCCAYWLENIPFQIELNAEVLVTSDLQTFSAVNGKYPFHAFCECNTRASATHRVGFNIYYHKRAGLRYSI
jgi:hypothetical protein